MSLCSDASMILEVFQQFDTNNEGFITQTELADVIRKISPPDSTNGILWTDEQIKTLLQTIDTSGDGKIQYQEFVAWVFGNESPGGQSGTPRSACTPRSSGGTPRASGAAGRRHSKSKHEKDSKLGVKSASVAEEEEEEGDEEEGEDDEGEEEEEEEASEEEEEVEEDEEEEESSSEEDDAHEVRKRILNAGRNLVWQKLMPAEEGTARAAAEAVKKLPPPDEAHAEDAHHVELYLKHFTDDRELDGVAPKGAKRKLALRWLHAALDKISQGDHSYQLPVKYLLGSWRLWPKNDDGNEEQFVKLKRFAEKKLDVIGIDFERDIYEGRGLGKELGSVGSDIPPARPRQDEGLPMPKDFKPDREFSDPEDTFYMALLLTAVHAVDPLFQADAKKVCEAAGGDWKGPAPKGFMRMLAKLTTDHAEAKMPRPAENIDTNRAAWTFEEPAQMRAAFEGIKELWGPPLRVKNGYSPAFKALDISKGYRNILANYRFAPEGLTWGQLAEREDVQARKAWAKLRQKMLQTFLRMGYADEDSLDPEWRHYLGDFDLARRHMRTASMRDKQVELVVEIQYMLRPYMDMRKKTHAWYKIVRADNAEAMVFDYMAH